MKRFGAALVPPKGMSDEKKALFAKLRSELLSLYAEKSRAIADRETDRYRYLMQWRSQLAGVLNAISEQVFIQNDAKLSSVWNNLQKSIKASIMMTDMNGVDLPGFKPEPLPQSIREAYTAQGDSGEFSVSVTGVPGILSTIRKLTSDDGGWLYLERFTGPLTPLSFLVYVDQFGSIQVGDQSFSSFPWTAKDIAGNCQIQNLSLEQKLAAGTQLAGILEASGLYVVLSEGEKLFEALILSTLNVGDVLRAIKDVEARIDDLVASYHEDAAGEPVELIAVPSLPEMSVSEKDVLDQKIVESATSIPKAEKVAPTVLEKKPNRGLLLALGLAAVAAVTMG